MKRWLTVSTSLLAAAAILAAATHVGAESFDFELKRLESPANPRTMTSSADAMFRATIPQQFFMQVGGQAVWGPTRTNAAEFSKVIKKEPAKYSAKNPFRGVAKLGTQQFGFVLDAVPDEKKNGETKPKAKSKLPELRIYNRLYFDLNHNGDLTDDQVVKANENKGRIYTSSSYSYGQYSFPRVDVTVDADGTKVDYAFLFSGYAQAQENYQYATASLNSAAYREGEITLGGKKRRVLLVDYNSNARFDDKASVSTVRTSEGTTTFAMPGDMIYIDPDPSGASYMYGYDATTSDDQQYVAELIDIDGKFYEMDLTAAGDKVTLTASTAPVGYVKNPSKGYRAIVFSDKRVLKISWNESGKSALPVGDWKLASYTIDGTGQEATAKADKNQSSLLNMLANAISGSRAVAGPRFTMVSARAPGNYAAVKVREGKTVDMPFGPPYKPVVAASPQGNKTVSLSMSLVGAAGESCSNLMVSGRRPADPRFTITKPDGTEVQTGKFEYG